jgi:hypothetical protein
MVIMMRRLFMLGALLAGCATFAPVSIVVDLRVLGIRADLPEVVVTFDPQHPEATQFPTVHLTALVADPGAQRRLAWEMSACAPTLSERCDDPTATVQAFASGTIDDPEGPHEVEIEASYDVALPVLEEAIGVDAINGHGGVPVQIELCVRPEGESCSASDAVWASKWITYASNQIPPGRVGNTNPRMTAVYTDTDVLRGGRCWQPGNVPLDVMPEEIVELRPIAPPSSREVYQLLKLSGGFETVRENLTYSWFATGGSWSKDQSGGPTDIFGNVPRVETEWQAPSAADAPADGLINMWVVQRDERGGQSWTQRCFHVVN